MPLSVVCKSYWLNWILSTHLNSTTCFKYCPKKGYFSESVLSLKRDLSPKWGLVIANQLGWLDGSFFVPDKSIIVTYLVTFTDSVTEPKCFKEVGTVLENDSELNGLLEK